MKNKTIIFSLIMLSIVFVIFGYVMKPLLIPTPTNSAVASAYDWWEYPQNPPEFPTDPNMESFMKIPKVKLSTKNELILEVNLYDGWKMDAQKEGWPALSSVEYAVASDGIYIMNSFNKSLMKYQNGKRTEMIKVDTTNVQDLWTEGDTLYALEQTEFNGDINGIVYAY